MSGLLQAAKFASVIEPYKVRMQCRTSVMPNLLLPHHHTPLQRILGVLVREDCISVAVSNPYWNLAEPRGYAGQLVQQEAAGTGSYCWWTASLCPCGAYGSAHVLQQTHMVQCAACWVAAPPGTHRPLPTLACIPPCCCAIVAPVGVSCSEEASCQQGPFNACLQPTLTNWQAWLLVSSCLGIGWGQGGCLGPHTIPPTPAVQHSSRSRMQPVHSCTSPGYLQVDPSLACLQASRPYSQLLVTFQRPTPQRQCTLFATTRTHPDCRPATLQVSRTGHHNQRVSANSSCRCCSRLWQSNQVCLLPGGPNGP
jgi:hypothetical protein